MNASPDTDALELVRQIARAELSLRSRVAHGVLLAAALAMTVVIVSLWMTEPSLPPRTRTAFAVLTMIGTVWTGYAAWVLLQRRVLFARQQVVAGRLAVLFTSIFAGGALWIGIATNAAAGYAAAVLGLALVAVAALLLSRAKRRLAALLGRRHALEALRAGGAR